VEELASKIVLEQFKKLNKSQQEVMILFVSLGLMKQFLKDYLKK